ncbi:YdeI/OmpD-associated family protein [Echinicola sp. CAU 1574]|uniref:YdeI/OmpD-associated family protein n=1 Tax=Echinicola arenosa TaxID=2774144 RepID=A0ABR9ALZ6_9BACT|nr:YdeI/OmpD-associated family protein [Echinicola arenosa]MBD8489715.1 YdeI/OmpD-associated family protein [Echinicola arenosa]
MNGEIESFDPADKKAWREWLEKNHKIKDAVWLIIHKKGSSKPNLSWSETVDEALCFGWIDSTKRPIDSEKYIQYFGKRKPNSIWSKINKDKIEQLITSGLMSESGLESVKIAKQNGSWTLLDSAEKLEIPVDLEEAFGQRPAAKTYFLSLSKSSRKSLLQWIAMAKRPATREKRISELIESASKEERPKQFR